jgi:hypothetical protein
VVVCVCVGRFLVDEWVGRQTPSLLGGSDSVTFGGLIHLSIHPLNTPTHPSITRKHRQWHTHHKVLDRGDLDEWAPDEDHEAGCMRGVCVGKRVGQPEMQQEFACVVNMKDDVMIGILIGLMSQPGKQARASKQASKQASRIDRSKYSHHKKPSPRSHTRHHTNPELALHSQDTP